MDETKSPAPSVLLKCGGCGKAYKVHPDKLPEGVTSFPCRACGALVPIGGIEAGPASLEDHRTVLVVVEEKELTELVVRILNRNGYRGLPVYSGADAVSAALDGQVDVVLVSVYLPDMMGYEILDKINAGRKEMGRIPSLLLSSVHHAARYKRAPTSLYGADDYVERHHLPDLLVPKIERLLDSAGEEKPALDPQKLPPPADEQVMERRQLEDMELKQEPSKEPALEELRRLCRVIAGDIALYNEDVIGQNGLEQILDAIAGDLEEGDALLDKKFPGKGEQAHQLLREEMVSLLESRGITGP